MPRKPATYTAPYFGPVCCYVVESRDCAPGKVRILVVADPSHCHCRGYWIVDLDRVSTAA